MGNQGIIKYGFGELPNLAPQIFFYEVLNEDFIK